MLNTNILDIHLVNVNLHDLHYLNPIKPMMLDLLKMDLSKNYLDNIDWLN